MGRINGVNQNQMLRSDLELNQDDNSKKVMSTRTAAVAVQYTKDHIDNISHGFKRFVLCVFTLGINELLRSKYARDYEANITKMSDDIGKIHSALKEEVGERQLKDLDAEIKHEKLYGIDHRFEYKEHTTELKLSMGNVTLTRHVNGNGTLRFADGSEENISNCANVRQRLEIDVMKNAKIFRKSLVMQILNEYRDKITSNEVPNSAKASLEEQGTIVLKAIQDVKMPETNATIRAAARNRLNELLGILFKDNLNLSEETTATLDPNFGVQMAEKLLNGELDSPETFKEFLNRGISGTNLGTDEATKLAAKLEKAQDEYNKYQQADFPTRLRMEAEPPNPASLVSFAEQYVDRKPTESLPQGESREVHDFAAEIILSEDITKYDNALEQGHLTGARLAKIFKKNYELVGRMMANRLEIKENKEISDMLATVEPSLAGKISEILDKLNDDFASEKKKNEEEIENTKKALEEEKNSDIYCKEEKERRINKKEEKLNKLLKEKTTKEAKSSAEQRADFVMHYLKNISKIQHGIAYKMGAKFVEDINPQEMAYRSEQVTEGYVIVEEEKDQWNNVKYTIKARSSSDKMDVAAAEMQQDARKIAYESDNPQRAQEEQIRMKKRFDYFAAQEEKINESVAKQCEQIQEKINKQLDKIFVMPEERKYTNDEFARLSLSEQQKAYAVNDEVYLIKTALKSYFKDMSVLDQRRMIAAQTRFCEHNPNTTAGAKLGALLKGAGPVMQKMLQGLDETAIKDETFKEALADMKDGLAPLSEDTIRAQFFDMIERSKKEHPENPIVGINVLASVGQASVGQSLNCVFTFRDGTTKNSVTKILRPDAAITMQREDVVFTKAAEEVKNGMPKTYRGRFKSITAELDFTQEAKNVQRGQEVYGGAKQGVYQKQKVIERYGTFNNIATEQLVDGIAPTQTSLSMENAGDMTLKKFLLNASTVLKSSRKKLEQPAKEGNEQAEMANVEPPSLEDLRHLDELSKKLRKTYSSLTSLAFLWVNEGLFGSGFSHDDLHTANLMLNGDKLVIIDYGNCMQLTSAERTDVISAVCGVAVCDVDIFIKGFRNMLSPESVALFDRNRDAIKERLSIIFSAKNKGLDKTAQRLDVALKLFQKDYKIEVPPQIHNFLEGQTRLQNAMTQNLQLIEQINELRNQYGTAFGNKELSEDEKTIIANSAELTEEQKGDKLPSMMKCLTDVVKNNINAKLLNAIGLKNAKSVYNSIKDELVKIKG
ncbi:MAG: AarF/UbiB family protein [Lentisphaeria bacterium]|nr:AarF/UbiB family protein [Lentisphaeria bacterium]